MDTFTGPKGDLISGSPLFACKGPKVSTLVATPVHRGSLVQQPRMNLRYIYSCARCNIHYIITVTCVTSIHHSAHVP
jgi:hypothetical protein